MGSDLLHGADRQTDRQTDNNDKFNSRLSQFFYLDSKGRISKLSEVLEFAFQALERAHKYSFQLSGQLDHRLCP